MLDEVKSYARAEEEKDSDILSLQLAAEEYLTNAGVNKDYSKALYQLAIKLLVTHWNENRTLIGKADKLAFSLDSIITQLKFTQ